MKLKIVAPEKNIYEGEVDKLTAKTEAGEVTILPGHIPLIAPLASGVSQIWEKGNNPFKAQIDKGFLHVGETETIILADSARIAS